MTKPNAYVTLLTNESYLPGSLTLGHRLKTDFGTKHKLVILLDTSSVSAESIQLIEQVYDEIVPVDDQLINAPLGRLVEKLGRAELSVTFTKLLLWNQTQYDTIAYLDSDTLPLTNLDDIFTQYDIGPGQVVASPDAGWPDIFNSGVLVLKPSELVFGELLEFAQDDANTFDGADQGLLNEFFNTGSRGANWFRLPFLFNVTPNLHNHYQYYPAYQRFLKDIKLLHFIGANKPWHAKDISASNTDNFHHLWWASFNKLFEDDIKFKLLLVAAPVGEAHKLKFDKNKNIWDQNKDVTLVLDTETTSPSIGVFPWEDRVERPATRVFHSSTNVEPIHASASRRSSSELGKTIKDLADTKISDKPSSLLKNYDFKDAGSFNPDKSFAEVSKLPLQFLTKQNEAKSKNKPRS